MPSTKPTQFPAEYRDIVQRLADPSTSVQRRAVPCGSEREAKAMQWHLYRYLTVCERAGPDEGGPSMSELRAFRQCYALTVQGSDLVFLPRSDSPRARTANAFLMTLLNECVEPAATAKAPPIAPGAAAGLFSPTGKYLVAAPDQPPTEPPPELPLTPPTNGT